jgi:hypothetical protein
MASKQTFADVASKYLAERAVSASYGSNVTRIAGRVGTMSSERVNEYLKARLQQVATTTARAERTILLTLWRDAYERGAIDDPPRGIMRVKARRAPTRAWTVDEVKLAIRKIADYREERLRSGCLKRHFLMAWFLLGYESGSRHGDIWRFTAANLDGDLLRWTQHKTGDGIVKVLTPACVAACRTMLEQSPDGRIIGWACGRRMAYRHMRLHLDWSGIGGTSKFLRRSSATHIEIETPGMASLHLGHRTATLAAQAYLDWGQIRRRSPQPPALVTE